MKKLLLLGLALSAALFPSWAQTASSPSWNPSPAEAEATALAQKKPLVLLWQSGSGAPAFTQSVDRLFSSWPEWTKLVSQTAVFTRGRSWEGPLPSSFPALPEGGKVSVLLVWNPEVPGGAVVWTEVPPALELSRTIASRSGKLLDDPYSVDVTAYVWDGGTLTRVDSGPRWIGSAPEGPSEWVEEGPLGTVLVLKEGTTGRRAAVPLEGDWSFLYDAAAQSWAPWNLVQVKR